MSETKDYYSILGVLPSAEIIVIRAAYRALAQKYHPDKWTGEKFEADRRMRQLNEAYEVLSNEIKRKSYDSQRKQQNDDSFDFDDDTMRSAFGEAEKAQESDWIVAVEYYPDLSEIYQRLKRISDKLAFAYRSTMLESKDFKKRRDISEAMERQFLERYFGKNQELLQFAKWLIKTGNRSAAKELNRVVAVLGGGADAELVIRRVATKFPSAAPFQNERKNPDRSPESARDLARRVIATQHVEDAKCLIDRLGGRVRKKGPGLFGTESRVVVILDEHLTLPMSFSSDYELTQWVIKNVAPKYK